MAKFYPSNIIPPVETTLERQVTAGVVGSFITNLVLNPLMVIKVRLQQKQKDPSQAPLTIKQTVTQISKDRGIRGFWAGTSMGLLMSMPSSVLYMVSYEKCKSIFYTSLQMAVAEDRPPCTLVSNMILPQKSCEINISDRLSKILFMLVPGVSGALARVVSVTMIAPIELIRTIQTSGIEKKNTAIQILGNILRNKGLAGLYRGWLPTIMRDCPYSAIYWFNFEFLRPIYLSLMNRFAPPEKKNKKVTPFINFISGASGSMLAAIFTHPFDVVKTQSQLAVMNREKPSISPTGVIINGDNPVTVRSVLQESGIRGLYRGLSMRLFTVIPGSAIMVTIYETVKGFDKKI